MLSRRSRPRLEALEARVALSNFYVATTGDDHNPGTLQAPWATLQHAVDSAVPGDTIRVESGTYVGCRAGRSGQPGAPITLMADTGAHVLINAPGPANRHRSDIEIEQFGSTITDWVVDGIEVANAGQYGIDIRTTDRVTVQNCYAHNNGLTGIYFSFSDHLLSQNNESAFNSEHGMYDANSNQFATIRGNRFHDNVASGLHMNGDVHQGGPGIITNALVEKNVIYSNGRSGGAGINCDGVQNSVFQNNLLYDAHGAGIALFRFDASAPSINDVVVNNTVLVAVDGR